MGSLKIRRVLYEGDNYFYNSPYLSDGIQILVAENGGGKTTFSSLISFGLGTYVKQFNFSDSSDEQHQEIKNDSNNYVVLDLELSGEVFTIKRFFGENSKVILVEGEGFTETFYVARYLDNKVFSDWLLNKLGIPIFDLYQGSKSFKINFSDLFRLIHYDQASPTAKIFKEHRTSSNYISDSLLVRRTIFEVLMGHQFAEYHSLLGEYNLLSKEKESLSMALKNLKNTFLKIGVDVEQFHEEENLKKINAAKSQLEKLELYKQSLFVQPVSTSATDRYIKTLRENYFENEKTVTEYKKQYKNLLRELSDLKFLKDNLMLEVTQIKKILMSHERLALFSQNTCPVCLKEVHIHKGKCICGNDINEDEYEKFFYSTEEYFKILQSKQKSVETIDNAILSCELELKEKRLNFETLEIHTTDLLNKINEIEKSGQLKTFDQKFVDINEKILDVKTSIKEENKVREYFNQYKTIFNEFNQKESNLKNKLLIIKRIEADLDEKLSKQIQEFTSIYFNSISTIEPSITKVDLNEEYLPIINSGTYREASLSVIRKLTYFMTLLQVSVKQENLSFPKFLLIDTPANLGIDDDKLNRGIGLVNSVYLESEKIHKVDFQVILTTGLDKYPQFYEKNVFGKIEGNEKLLIRKPTN